MPTLNIAGKRVTVGDEFLSMTPDQQNASVDEIAKSLNLSGPSSTVGDIAKSAGAGIVRGVAGIAGLPGDIGRAMKVGSDYLFGPSPELSGTPFTTSQITKGIESVTGPLYEPQTTAGEYARTIGEFVPAAALGPGGAVRSAVRYGVVPAISSETAGQATKGTAAEPYARAGVAIGTGGILALRDRPVVVPQQFTGQNNVAADFNIPLSRGQSTGSVTDQIMEQAAARGGLGAQAEQKAKDFFESQRAATEAARAGIGSNLDRFGQTIAASPQEAADLVGETVRGLERTSKQNYRNLYDEAKSLPGEFQPSAFEGVGQKIKENLSQRQSPVIIDDVTTPVASRVLKDVEDQIGKLRIQNRADPAGLPNPENIVGPNLQGVDQARKRLVSLASGAQRGSADARASRAVINEFDSAVEDAVANGLFHGDERALSAIKDARRAYSEHQKTFFPRQSGDDVGRAIERIVGRDNGEGATTTEIARYLYGEAKTGAPGLSVRLTGRLRNMLGKDSPEWAGVRQGLWSHLTSPPAGAMDWGPQKISQRITEFLNGSGKPMSQIMFTPEERATMQKFAKAVRETMPAEGSVNRSNTAPVMARIAGNAFDAIAGMLGFSQAGFVGLGAASAARVGRNFLKNSYNERKVTRSLYPQARREGSLEALGRVGISSIPASIPFNQ